MGKKQALFANLFRIYCQFILLKLPIYSTIIANYKLFKIFYKMT